MKCLKCGGEIILSDIYDEDLIDDDTTIFYCLGVCKNCGKEYEYEKILKTVEEKNLKEFNPYD